MKLWEIALCLIGIGFGIAGVYWLWEADPYGQW